MKKIMAVVTAETIYSERFCDYVNGSGLSELRSRPFPTVEAFLVARKERGPDSFPVLLCDEELFAESRGFDFTGTVVLLLSEAGAEGTLAKYQSGPALLRDVLTACADLGIAAEAPKDRRKLQIYAVWGAENSEARLFFSLALCRMLARRKMTVYMDLKEFSGLSAYTGKVCDRGLSTALYYMKQGKLDGQRLMGLMEECEGIRYLPPITSSEDMELMSDADRNRLFTMLAEETPVECVVADIPDSLAARMEIPEMSEKIFLINSGGPVAGESLQQFRKMLENAGRKDILEKIVETGPLEERETFRPGNGIDGVIYSETGDRIRRALEI